MGVGGPGRVPVEQQGKVVVLMAGGRVLLPLADPEVFGAARMAGEMADEGVDEPREHAVVGGIAAPGGKVQVEAHEEGLRAGGDSGRDDVVESLQDADPVGVAAVQEGKVVEAETGMNVAAGHGGFPLRGWVGSGAWRQGTDSGRTVCCKASSGLPSECSCHVSLSTIL